MCAGALNWSQLPRLVYGASDVQRGYSVTGVPLLHPKTEVIKDVLVDDCTFMIREFFKKIRKS
jgi:tRNA(adenine34) deaminase